MTDSLVGGKNEALIARAERFMAGGAPAAARLPDVADFVVARGKGARVWDVDGREYVDFVLGSGPMILGHAHPAVMQAVTRQLELGTQFYMTTPPAIELAETIVEAAGGAGQVKFASSGGEAIAHAIRLARAASGRNKILKFEGGYHGGQDSMLLSVTPPRAGQGAAAVPDSAGITPGVQQDVLIAPYNDLEATSTLLAQHAADVAAVVVDAGQRCITPAPGFLAGLRDLTRQHGSLLIVDEVVTGFRLGFGGAREFYGLQPDLACYAKILGGGYPLSAIWGRSDLLAASDPRRRDPGRVQVRGTLNGNPVGCVAGLTTIAELCRPGNYARLHELGQRLRSGLMAAAARQRLPLQVFGDGPLAGIAISDTPIIDYGGILASDRSRLAKMGIELLRRGILVNLDAKFYLSLAHTDADLVAAIEAFEESIVATA